MDVCVSRDDHAPCIDLLLEGSDDAIFEGVVPFIGGSGFPKIFAKEEPSDDDELDSMIMPVEDNPADLASRKRGPGYIGAYSPEERRERIARFHEKRARRVWKKRVTYSTRKNIANKRMRIKGRFIKKEEESLMKELGSWTGDDALGDEPLDPSEPGGSDVLSGSGSETPSDADDDVCGVASEGVDDDAPFSAALGSMLGDDFS